MLNKEFASTAATGGRSGRGTNDANRSRPVKLGVVLALAITMATMFIPEGIVNFKAGAATLKGFAYSTPITLNAAGTQLWVVNPDPDNNSVTVINVAGDAGTVVKEIPVGKEPRSVA